MNNLILKIATPIILVGIFASTIFLSLGYKEFGTSFYIVLLLFIIFTFFFGLSIGQSLSIPIKKILERATDLIQGDLKARTYIKTKDEVSELADVFNEIADELEKSRLESENAEKSVDIKVRAKTQAFEETINALEQKVKNRTIEMQGMAKDIEDLRAELKLKDAEMSALRSYQSIKNKKVKQEDVQ
jgi:methyl-accepting chemotaxis protein